MSTEQNEDPEQFHREIVAAAKDAEALVVDGLVQGNDKDVFPTVVLTGENSAKIIRYAKPRLVYLTKLTFEVEAEVSEVNGSGSFEEKENEVAPPFEKLMRKWKRRNGETALVVGSFVVDGVLHTSVSAPKWKSEFDIELSEAEEEVSQLQDDLEASLEAADQKDVEEKASALAENPSFSAGRSSFAKRKLLAGKVFPGLPESKLANIVKSADKIVWLKKSIVE